MGDNMQCYCRHNMNIDECQDDRAWDTFVFKLADSSPRWHEYMGKNCYKGHGSSDPIGSPEQLRVHTVDSCADRCKQISAVGFVLTSDNMQCYCRHNMNIDECQDDRAWDTFVFKLADSSPRWHEY